LTRLLGVALAEHVGRLNRSREVFLKELEETSFTEWRRLRPSPKDDEEEITME
jgi:hypothetical protein